MSTSNDNMLTAAIQYAEMGFPVFPCIAGSKKPLTKHGFKDATTNIEAIESFWRKNPKANIGIPTNGLLVVDIDGEKNPWPKEIEQSEDLACGPLALTAGGGRHYIFKQPAGKDWKNTTGKIAPKVDTRANGGYIVAPPSVVDGKLYRWAEGMDLDVTPDQLPEPPGWLVVLLDNLATGAHTPPQCANDGSSGNMIPSGQRNDALARLTGNMRRVGMSQSEILPAIEIVNADRCNPPLKSGEVKRIVASICRYDPDQVSVAVAENHYQQDEDAATPKTGIEDPGDMPDELLRVPGFISELMDYCLDTAPYPNSVMSFCGALALQAFLAGRKVRDQGDNRTNLYLLGLAHSSAGKDWPRKINTRILHQIGMSDGLGERFASGEGVQDALFLKPTMLFQTDEIDGMLQSINKSKDARHESIMGTLLTLYSSANSVFPMRRKAGKESPGAIVNPCLVVFGTAIPNHYYEALSERMLTNGFFARMIILENAKRGKGQEPSIREIPKRIIETAKWWSDFLPGTGNLENWHPDPVVVGRSDEAARILIAAREEAEAEYVKAEERSDSVGTTVWGRVSEQSRKLALIHAISANHKTPCIDEAAATWATRFIMHQTRRMLFMAQAHVADNPFHADCLKLLKKLRDAPDRTMAHSLLLKRMKTDAQTFGRIVSTLAQQGDIEIVIKPRAGTPSRSYKLASEIRGQK
jgi:hypothetical protein